MSPGGYGIYAFVFSLITLMSVPVQMGLPVLVIRQVARYHYARKWSYIKGLLKRANQFVASVAILIAVIAVLFGRWPSKYFDTATLDTFWWGLLLLPLVGFNRIREAALQGLQRVLLGQLPEKLILPSVLIVFLALAHVHGDLTPQRAMMIYCLAAIVAFAFGLMFLRRSLPREIRNASATYDTAGWARSVLPLSLLAGLNVITGHTDILMLGALVTSEAVGLYRVAFAGAALVIFTTTAINAVLAPRVARMHQAGDQEGLQWLVTRCAQFTLIAALPVVAILVLMGDYILALVFGEAFRPSWTPMAVLSVGQLANVAVGSVYVILNMTGNERETLKGAGYAAVLNVGLNFALIPYFGTTGAAVATSASIVFVNVWLLRSLWKRTGIWSAALPLRVGMASTPDRT